MPVDGVELELGSSARSTNRWERGRGTALVLAVLKQDQVLSARLQLWVDVFCLVFDAL